ncbi:MULTISPECIES: DUF3349 domain-containing protein [Nocardia]|uniref:DUF3349 domain-containing protein n=1 Tax=Nocardia TaxID=1817 RepID=UPI0002DE61E8|nr:MULTISPECIES: DUF3349 domain-containing protein [Nocardia]
MRSADATGGDRVGSTRWLESADRCARTLLRWLRAGYPGDAPRTGYVPLLALCSRPGLSAAEIAAAVEVLAAGPAVVTDFQIQRVILEHADSLPDATDIDTVAKLLGDRRRHAR